MKKNRKKKGFTLIELIVVIAVLAILALIAVPRLAGFTDRAKMANDKEYAAIAANSIQILVASEEIQTTNAVADGTVTYNGTWTFTDLLDENGVALVDGACPLIEGLSGLETLEHYTSFTITVPDNGDINKDTNIAYAP